MKRFFLLTLCLGLLTACMATGPRKTLEDAANALANNSPAAFLANFNMENYTRNYITNLTSNDTLLNSMKNFGSLLGLGNVDSLINDFFNVQSRIINDFEEGVASGELMLQCAKGDSTNCPWVPDSLRTAHIVELSPNAAIARVTTPAQLTCWLALHKFGEKWQIVGSAVRESEASKYASNVQSQPSPGRTPKKARPRVPENQPKHEI